MMRKILIYLWHIVIASGLFSCEKEIEVALPDYDTKLVVEGWIEQGKGPVVILSRSAGYFDQIDSTSIRKLIVTTAKVTVSSGEEEEVLTLVKDSDIFPYYIYQGNSLKGESGKSYKLTVESAGKTYTAETSVPTAASLDSIWFELLPGEDSLGYLWASLQDDVSERNYYRLFTKRKHLDKKYVPVYLSTITDQYFEGERVDFSLLRGAENLADVKDDLYFSVGDTVSIRLCTMPRAHYDFWRTVEQEMYTGANPFVSTGNDIISNIEGEGGALGIWGGYGASYYTFVVR